MASGNLSVMFQNQEDLKGPVEGKTSGQVPEWISGTYLRVGPGLFDCGKVKLNHFIDGYSFLSKFDFKNGKVTLHKKFLKTEAYKKMQEHKEPFFPEFGTKGNIGSQKSIFSRLISTFSSVDVTDNDSLNVFQLGSDVYASTETMHITKVKTANLDASDRIDYAKVFGVHMATAHPLVDSKGDWYNIGTSFTTGAKYQVCKVPANSKDGLKKGSVLCTIPTSWRGYYAYYHTFGMTDNYIVHIEQPWTMGELKIIDAKLKGKSIRDLFEWSGGKDLNRFHIVDKKTGTVYSTRIYSKTPFFFFHIANAFEDGDNIVLDILTFEDSSIIEQMEVQKICNRDFTTQARITRFVIPIVKNIKDVQEGDLNTSLSYTTATASKVGDKIVLVGQNIGEPGLESPCINESFRFNKSYQFVYGSGLYTKGPFENSLVKINVLTGETKTWKDPAAGAKGIFPGDPKFIARPNGKSEDDGVVLAACCDPNENGKDFLVILNAESMEEIARVEYDVRLPQSIHSIFVSE